MSKRYCPGITHKQQHRLIFLVGKLIAAAGGRQFKCLGIQRGVSESKRIGLLDIAFPRQHPKPRQQLPHIKGFGQIVVGSGIQPDDFVVDFRLGCEQQYGCGIVRLSHLDEHRNTVHHRHHNIQNRSIIKLAEHNFKRSVFYIIHPPNPFHLIVCFELFGNTLTLCRLIYQPKEKILCLLVNICKIGIQFAAGQQMA